MPSITVPKAKKEVECTSGAPACESDKIKCKVVNPGQGSITIELSGKDIADGVPIRRKGAGTGNQFKKVGPIACVLCSNPTPGGCHRCYVSFTLKKKDLENPNITDEAFAAKYTGFGKSSFVQAEMSWACDEWMSGPPGGNIFIQRSGFKPSSCQQPQVFVVSGVIVKIEASMKVYFFRSNCVKEEITITDSIKFSITGKTISLPCILGVNVTQSGQKGPQSNLYGVPYRCPMMEADVFCGTCYYIKKPGNSFMQPECFQPQSGTTLGGLADKAQLVMTSDRMGKNPTNPFAGAAEARDSLAQEIEQKVQARVPELVTNLVAVAQNLAKNKPNGVCGLGYELNDDMNVSFTIQA